MYKQIREMKKGNILGLSIREGLSDKENEELVHLLVQTEKDSGKIRLLLILENYPMADSAEALYEDLNFVKQSADKIERMAVVGDKAWQDTWIALFGLFGGLDTSYFEPSDADRAVNWLQQET
jgi:hypothetical protein